MMQTRPDHTRTGGLLHAALTAMKYAYGDKRALDDTIVDDVAIRSLDELARAGNGAGLVNFWSGGRIDAGSLDSGDNRRDDPVGSLRIALSQIV
jgi:hypothetical protein